MNSSINSSKRFSFLKISSTNLQILKINLPWIGSFEFELGLYLYLYKNLGTYDILFALNILFTWKGTSSKAGTESNIKSS